MLNRLFSMLGPQRPPFQPRIGLRQLYFQAQVYFQAQTYFQALAALAFFCLISAIPLSAEAQTAPKAGEAAAASGNSAPLGVQTGLPPGIKLSETMVFGNWTVVCTTPIDSTQKRTCSATLQLVETKSNQPLLTLTFDTDEAGKAVGAVITPSGIQIAPGVEVTIGKTAPRKLAVASCENRCNASLTVDAALARDLSAAETINVGIINLNGQKITLQAPVKGFKEAWALAGKQE